mmetsp:Transcript_10332/g.29508  ORF Transcript_10332/g.29508 Transcript_10332/m.29508 type:complete len:743 (-) Transcript_10332:171-2399(-)
MPPKKGKKKTKAELEAERIAAEEEAERLRQAEQKRLEEERVAREERRKKWQEEQVNYRMDELTRLKEELFAGKHALQESKEKLAVKQEAKTRDLEWQRYLECDPSPDASSESDLNTYVSLSRETQAASLQEALERCSATEDIVQSVRRVWAEAQARGDSSLASRQGGFCERLRESSSEQLNSAALHVLRHADEYLEDDQVLLAEEKAGVAVGLWVNLIIKSFRGPVKPIMFKNIGLQVDIPKALNQQRIAVRAMFLPYDPVTNAVSDSEDLVLGGVMQVDLLAQSPPAKKLRPKWVLRPSRTPTVELERVPFGEDSPNSASAQQPLRCTFRIPDSVYFVPSESPRIVTWDAKISQWTSDGVNSQVVEYNEETRALRFLAVRTGLFALVQSRIAHLPFTSWKLEPALRVRPEDEDEEDEGGCVHYTVVAQSVEIKIQVRESGCELIAPAIPGLQFREMGTGELLFALRDAGINLMPTDADVARIPPFEDLLPVAAPPEAPPAAADGEEAGEEAGETKMEQKEEEEKKDAAAEGGAAEENGTADGEGSAPVEAPAQAAAEPLGPVRTPLEPKVKEMERKLSSDVARLASSFDFEGSTWNHLVGSQRSVMKVRETSVYTGGNEETFDFKLVLAEMDAISESARKAPGIGDLSGAAVKYSFLNMKDDGAASADPAEHEEDFGDPTEAICPGFSDKREQGTLTHVFLNFLVKEQCSEEANERVESSSEELAQAVERLLLLTRPFSFS